MYNTLYLGCNGMPVIWIIERFTEDMNVLHACIGRLFGTSYGDRIAVGH